jgi:hypothetical protein
MSKKDKLIIRLKSSPKDFTFDEMRTLLGYLAFIESNKGKTSGSRIIFRRNRIAITLHKPHPQNTLKEYALKQITEILEREKLI